MTTYLILAILCLIGNVIFMVLVTKEGRKAALKETEKNLITAFNDLDSIGRAEFIANAKLNKKEIITQINNQTINSATEIILEVQDKFGIIKVDLKKKSVQIEELEDKTKDKNILKSVVVERLKYLIDEVKNNGFDKTAKNDKDNLLIRENIPKAHYSIFRNEFLKSNDFYGKLQCILLKNYFEEIKKDKIVFEKLISSNPGSCLSLVDLKTIIGKYVKFVNTLSTFGVDNKETRYLILLMQGAGGQVTTRENITNMLYQIVKHKQERFTTLEILQSYMAKDFKNVSKDSFLGIYATLLWQAYNKDENTAKQNSKLKEIDSKFQLTDTK